MLLNLAGVMSINVMHDIYGLSATKSRAAGLHRRRRSPVGDWRGHRSGQHGTYRYCRLVSGTTKTRDIAPSRGVLGGIIENQNSDFVKA